MTKEKKLLGVIGGSGIYDIEGLENPKWKSVQSSFGKPSDKLLFGTLNNMDLVFLPRHGRGHKIPPNHINYQANIEVLKKVGVSKLVSFGAVGSLKKRLAPGRFVIVDQFIDRTINRKKSFFGPGLAAHIQLAHPTCNDLCDIIEDASKKLKINYSRGGCYLAMEGPQFSTLAESKLYQSWGCDVIGMTAMPEAKLSREAEICYSTIAMVTDYDCWHPSHDEVSVDVIIKTLNENSNNARNLLKKIIFNLSEKEDKFKCVCGNALDNAIITAPKARDKKMLSKLKFIISRVV